VRAQRSDGELRKNTLACRIYLFSIYFGLHRQRFQDLTVESLLPSFPKRGGDELI
jgi:hypothetical protein